MTSCTHGMPTGPSAALKYRLMLECSRTRQEGESAEQRGHLFFSFWTHPSRIHLVDEELVQIYLSFAVKVFMDIEGSAGEDIARHFAAETSLIQDIIALKSPEDRDDKKTCEFLLSTRTRSGLVCALAPQVPCSCLDEEVKQAKASSKMSACIYCGTEKKVDVLYKCSLCKIEYCSKECQKAGWKNHKKYCASFARQMGHEKDSKPDQKPEHDEEDRKPAAKTDPTMGFCEFCKDPQLHSELKKCGKGCGTEYCSRECQKSHWKQHKKVCAEKASLLAKK